MLLKNSVQSALECVGLDPAVGFLHALRPGRPALALDLMEELRAPLCDRMAISLINLRQIKVNDFENLNGRYILSDKARRIVIDEWQKRKREEIFHPFIDEKIEIGLIPFVSSLLLARVIRGDLDEYPAFLWR
jgi:CRISPR-associated protein Cas1